MLRPRLCSLGVEFLVQDGECSLVGRYVRQILLHVYTYYKNGTSEYISTWSYSVQWVTVGVLFSFYRHLSMQQFYPSPVIPLKDSSTIVPEGHAGITYAEVCHTQDSDNHLSINVSTRNTVVIFPLLIEEQCQAVDKHICFLK